jgi:hypothetical protein
MKRAGDFDKMSWAFVVFAGLAAALHAKGMAQLLPALAFVVAGAFHLSKAPSPPPT